MRLFEFGGTDYTRLIQLPSYQVQRLPVYTKWTDGNGVEHRDTTRQQLSGSFTLWIDDQSQYLAFLAALEASRAGDSSIQCKLYANNLDTVFEADCYVDLTFKNELPLLGRGSHGGISVKITER